VTLFERGIKEVPMSVAAAVILIAFGQPTEPGAIAAEVAQACRWRGGPGPGRCRELVAWEYERVKRPRRASAGVCTLANLTAALCPGSAALASYLRAVYGATGNATLARERELWFASELERTVNMVYERHLPPELQERCDWPAFPSGLGSVHGVHSYGAQPPDTLWIYRLPFPLPCPAFTPVTMFTWSASESLRSTWAYLVEHAPYVEATHIVKVERAVRETGNSSIRPARPPPDRKPILDIEHTALWLYLAVGSGLWFRGPNLQRTDKFIERWLTNSTRLAQLQRELQTLHTDTLVRVKCEYYSPAPRIEMISVRAVGDLLAVAEHEVERVNPSEPPVQALKLEEPRVATAAPPAKHQVCGAHFTASWPPAGGRPCTCSAGPPGRFGERALSCAHDETNWLLTLTDD
jgi:hypothetical protein